MSVSYVYYPEAVVNHVQSCIELADATGNYNKYWLDIKDYFVGVAKIGYASKGVKASQVVISTHNSGGLGFNAHDVHKNHAAAFDGGIDPSNSKTQPRTNCHRRTTQSTNSSSSSTMRSFEGATDLRRQSMELRGCALWAAVTLPPASKVHWRTL